MIYTEISSESICFFGRVSTDQRLILTTRCTKEDQRPVKQLPLPNVMKIIL